MFLASNFARSSSKTSIQRIVDSIVSGSTIGLTNSSSSLASSISSTLLNSGSSERTVSAFAKSRAESMTSAGSDVFHGLTGRNPARASASDITSKRRTTLDDTDSYIRERSPEGKIRTKKADKSLTIIAVL